MPMTREQYKFFRAQYLVVRPYAASQVDWLLFGLAAYWYREPGWGYQIERACQVYLDELFAEIDQETR